MQCGEPVVDRFDVAHMMTTNMSQNYVLVSFTQGCHFLFLVILLLLLLLKCVSVFGCVVCTFAVRSSILPYVYLIVL